MKKIFERNLFVHTLYSVIFIVIIFFVSKIPCISNCLLLLEGKIPLKLSFENLLSAQISLTFLITSLLSILSIKDRVLYGINIIQFKLEYPKHTNFVSIALYLIVLLLSSLIFFFLEENVLFLFSFFLSLLILTFLLVKILDVFFSREVLKERFACKIINEIQKDSSTKYLSDFFEDSLKLIFNADSYELKSSLLLYIRIINKSQISRITKDKLKNQFFLLSDRLAESHPSIFLEYRNLYLKNGYTEIYTNLLTSIVTSSILHNNNIELRNIIMYDLIRDEIERITPLFIEKLLELVSSPDNQSILDKINNPGDWEKAKDYMFRVRTEEYNKSINETEGFFCHLSIMYATWLNAACRTSNYEAIIDIYNHYKISEKGLFSLLDHNLKIIAGQTGFYLRVIDFKTLNYLKYIFLNGIEGHKIPDNMISKLINFNSLIISYEKRMDEKSGIRLKNRELLVKDYFLQIKEQLLRNGYVIELNECLNQLRD